jgi:preprotein translocase subunit SecE
MFGLSMVSTTVEKETGNPKETPPAVPVRARLTPKRFMEETRSEMQKVSWPNRQHVIQSTILIWVIVAFYSVLVAGADSVFTGLLNLLRKGN